MEKLEKKEKEIQASFEQAKAELIKNEARHAELMDLVKRLQGAHALIQEQKAELTPVKAKKDDNKKK